MNYEFPKIDHISQVLPAIANREEFRVIEKDDYTVVNYLVNFADTFPPVKSPNDVNMAIRRELRGMIFETATGKVLARRFHKFFNLGEREETMPHRVDFSKPHDILEKLDGSMLTPFMTNGRLRWGTKMGVTDISAQTESFVDAHPIYAEFSKEIIDRGCTPIYEWCSRKQRIVIDYPEDRLVLTAIRDNTTGQYLPLEAPDGVEIIKAWPGTVENLDTFVDMVLGLKGSEGCVIRFKDGHMIKIKAEEYRRVHATKDMIKFEKDVLSLILRGHMDDSKPFLELPVREAIDTFETLIRDGITQVADRLNWVVIAARDNIGESKKRFALEVVANHPNTSERGLLFKIWEGQSAFEVVQNYIIENTGSQTKVDSVRSLFGNHKWWDLYSSMNIPEE